MPEERSGDRRDENSEKSMLKMNSFAKSKDENRG